MNAVHSDIPMPLVTSGVEHGNIRELVLKRMKDLGLPCRDVRTREVGIRQVHKEGEVGQVPRRLSCSLRACS